MSQFPRIVTFGEIMLRLSPRGHQRLLQASTLDVEYGGGEANVAACLANFGLETAFVSRVPDNPVGEASLASLRKYGVDTRHVVRGGERLGIYFLETGAAQRGSLVVYDRADSAVARIEPGMVAWDRVFDGGGWFHWTGITPAISEGAAAVVKEALEAAGRHGVTVSCDLNYRAKLWKWGKQPGDVMPELVEHCDVIIGNEEDADKVFGIRASGADVHGGKIEGAAYLEVADQLLEKFPRCRGVAITLRTSLGASHNKWSSVYRTRDSFHQAAEYDILPIVDRVGGGDSFASGLIYGLNAHPDDPQKALEFATAASCLKHSIPGDVNLVAISEVEKLASGDASGRVAR